MKKEQKRYFLVEYYGIDRVCLVDTMEEVNHLLNEVKKYNNRKSSKFLFGNITVEHIGGKYQIRSHLYRKYTNRSTITDLDNLTKDLEEKDVAIMFKDKSKMINGFYPDINIAYFETKSKKDLKPDEKPLLVGVRYLPVLYKEDQKFLDKQYIKKCLYYHCETKDFNFFRDLANEFCIHHFVSDEVSYLYTIVNKCETMNENLNSLYVAASKLYDKFILEYESDESLSRDKDGKYIVSQRRLRDFGFFVKNYSIRDSKINSPLFYNKQSPLLDYYEESDGQLKLKL